MSEAATAAPAAVDYQTHPSKYRHWKLSFEGPIARLSADFDENAGLRPGYKLKLNSYDLGVDIELNDAVQRIRFEHPEVRTVVVTSAKEKVFCSGANIFMLGVSSHAWKVNFCKFTNETRNGLEDSSKHSGLKFLAAVNGACAGGGYELALACDEIILVDDRSSAVSLPEVPLLGVLPGTGGLTRVTDKRRVRHDLADIFCTTNEGVRGQRAKDWRLVDDIAKPAQFAAKVQERALQLAAQSDRPADARGVELTPLNRTIEADALRYTNVTVEIDRARRVATFTVKAPTGAQPTDIAGIEAAGAAWYPLQLARELEDAILSMRTNELEIGTWLIKTQGDAAAVLAMDATLLAHQGHWLVRETTGLLRRTLSRLDVSSRSLFALIEPGSCFAGTFLELALACARCVHTHCRRNRSDQRHRTLGVRDGCPPGPTLATNSAPGVPDQHQPVSGAIQGRQPPGHYLDGFPEQAGPARQQRGARNHRGFAGRCQRQHPQLPQTPARCGHTNFTRRLRYGLLGPVVPA